MLLSVALWSILPKPYHIVTSKSYLNDKVNILQNI